MRRIESLKEVLKQEKKISIIGHDNIDVDSFLSGILLSNFLNFLKIKNEFIILEKIIENESYQIIKELFDIDIKDYYVNNEDSSRKILLEDHYETKHLGEVLACIDHHPNCKCTKYPFLYSRIACSTSYLVYELIKESEYKISKMEAKMIVVSMLIDTVAFRSEKTVFQEALEAKKLSEQYGLNYEYLERYCLCLTPIYKYSIQEVINNGYKFYNYNGNRIKSSYIQVYGMPEMKKIDKWINYIQHQIIVENIRMWVFIIFECNSIQTYEYHITDKEFKLIISKGILSRGTNIMPKIEKMF